MTRLGFRSIGIVNGHDFADGQVYVVYRPQVTGRAYQCAAWQVVKDGFKTDPNAHWRDYFNKTFNVYRREDKAAKLAEALAWSGKKFNIAAWSRTPFGDWMDAEFVARRLKQLHEQLRATVKGE